MNSLCVIFALLSLSLFATSIESRVSAGGYIKDAIEKQPMPEELLKFVKAEQFELQNVDSYDHKAEKVDCHENEKSKIEFDIVEFEPRPNVPSYHDDSEVKGSRAFKDEPESKASGDMYPKDNGSKDKLGFESEASRHAFEEDFEPRPNLSMYNDQGK